MFMFELENQKVKLSPRSITVKDDNNKTIGVVRGIQCFKDCRPNLQMEIWKKARNSSADLSRIYYVDGKWYYLHDKKWDTDYFKYFEGRDSNMDKKYRERHETYEALVNENTIEVINCYIII